MQHCQILFDWYTSLQKNMTFSFKGKRYIYRLTRELYLQAHKIEADFIILPTNPYNLKVKSFGWYIECIKKMKCKIVLAKDEKIFNSLCNIFQQNAKLNVKLQVWKQSNFSQKELNSYYNKIIDDKLLQKQQQSSQKHNLGQMSSNNNKLPLACWFNNPPDVYSFYFPQFGTTILMSNQTSVHLINVEQKFIRTIEQFLIPLQRIQTLFLTIFQMHTFLGFFELFVNLKRFTVVTSLQIYQKLKDSMLQLFKVSEQMIKRRCSVRIIGSNTNLIYKKMVLSVSSGLSQSLKIGFDKQYVKIFSQEIDYYPKQLQQTQLVFLFLYSINPSYKETFQTIPEFLRRKIVLSRPTHKYNNKYFCTLNNDKQGNTRYIISKQIHKANQNVTLWLKQRQSAQHISIKILKDGQNINASKRVVKVQAGCLIGQKSNKVYLQGAQIINQQVIRCYKSARILLIDEHQYSMLKRTLEVDPNLQTQLENKLRTLIQQNTLLKSFNQSQIELLNSISKPNSYESGETIDLSQKKNQKVFFVLKGSMKWQGTDIFALKGFFIGNIQPFAAKSAIYGDISVVKDTWVIQIKLSDFFDYFLTDNPQVMIEILNRGIVFN